MWIEGREIEGLDLAAALDRLGDEEALLRVLQIFSGETRKLLDRIRHVTKDGLADYIITVHSIKGSCRGISAIPLGELAEKLERAARANQFEYVEANNAALVQAGEKLLSGLRRMLDSVIVKEKRDSPDPAVLAALLRSARIFDIDGVYDAISELERYEYETDAEWILSLRESVRMMEFKQIAERLSQMLEPDARSRGVSV